MAGVGRLVQALLEVSVPPDDFPAECDLGVALRQFFSEPSVQERMVEMNQSQLFDMQESRYGTRLGVYAEKTAKHKRRVGLPDVYYSYYETGRTQESLTVYAEDEFVGIYPHHEDAPEYAQNLDGNAWGLNNENFDELVPEMKDAVVNRIRQFLTNG